MLFIYDERRTCTRNRINKPINEAHDCNLESQWAQLFQKRYEKKTYRLWYGINSHTVESIVYLICYVRISHSRRNDALTR